MPDQLRVVPLTLAAANAEVRRLHRHHDPVVGHRWSIGVMTPDCVLVGAAIAGRPVARMLDDGTCVEVLRLVSDGTANACSCLYGAMRRIAREMGYERILTYTLASEPGTSLRAAGWERFGPAGGGAWSCPSRPREDTHPLEAKVRWQCWLVPTHARTIPARPVFGEVSP
jgi:hypothetical protein